MTTQTIPNLPTATGVNSVRPHKRPYTNDTSKLITPEKPLLIPPLVAAEIGLEAAIILQQIHYFSQNSKHILDDGKRWFYLTLEGWAEKLPFLKMSAIRRAIDKLRQLSLINVYRHSQHTWYQANWYTIHLENVKALWDRICQNQQIDMSNSDTSTCSEPANHIKEFSPKDFSTQQHAAADQDFVELDCSERLAKTALTTEQSTDTCFVEEQTHNCSSTNPETHEDFSSAAADEPVEKPSQQEVQEICNQLRQIPCTPAFRLSQEMMAVVNKFWRNVPGAIAYLKEALRTWKRVDSPEAVFVAACKNGRKPENWSKPLPNYPQPSDEDLAQLAEAKSTGRIKDYYRQPDGLWVVDTGGHCVDLCDFLST
jgi:hypothetical protein